MGQWPIRGDQKLPLVLLPSLTETKVSSRSEHSEVEGPAVRLSLSQSWTKKGAVPGGTAPFLNQHP
jgi:hypothetical protein